VRWATAALKSGVWRAGAEAIKLAFGSPARPPAFDSMSAFASSVKTGAVHCSAAPDLKLGEESCVLCGARGPVHVRYGALRSG
jgi:hypothetical protein